jgi:Peptidase A4 family
MFPLRIVLGLIVAVGASLFSSRTRAQSLSPYAVETNMQGFYAYTQPPAGFDPLSASAADLNLHGYPPRPGANASAEDFANWEKEANPNLRRIVPWLVRTNIYHRPLSILSRTQGSRNITSPNWSGYALVQKKPKFDTVTGAWIVPTAQPPFGGCAGVVYSSQWVGIDGFANDLLFQAGSEADASCSGGNLYDAWVEWLPASSVEINAPVNPGDYIIVSVTATDFSHGVSTSGKLVFTDVTENWQFSGTLTAASIGGTDVVGNSAEWIVERPEINGSLSPLANYIADPWFQALAGDAVQGTYHPGAPKNAKDYKITMHDNDDAPISFVNLFGTRILWFFDEGSAQR